MANIWNLFHGHYVLRAKPQATHAKISSAEGRVLNKSHKNCGVIPESMHGPGGTVMRNHSSLQCADDYLAGFTPSLRPRGVATVVILHFGKPGEMSSSTVLCSVWDLRKNYYITKNRR